MMTRSLESWLQLRVCAIKHEADNVKSFLLHALDGSDLPAWTPGAHIDVRLETGSIRQYSLCSDPGDRRQYRIAVLRESNGRGGSEHLHMRVDVGDLLWVREPRNHFPLVLHHAEYLLIAGGIGITPILAMINELRRQGKSSELYYGGRSSSSMAFTDELASEFDPVTIVTEDVDGRLDIETIISNTLKETAVYCCGPGGLITAVENACAKFGVKHLNIERFQASAESPRNAVPVDLATSSFVVELRRSGKSVVVKSGTSILKAVLKIKPDVVYSCEEGYCGACETRVLCGTPVHRDTVLTPELQASGRTMMICVGGSSSERLVLDL